MAKMTILETFQDQNIIIQYIFLGILSISHLYLSEGILCLVLIFFFYYSVISHSWYHLYDICLKGLYSSAFLSWHQIRAVLLNILAQ